MEPLWFHVEDYSIQYSHITAKGQVEEEEEKLQQCAP